MASLYHGGTGKGHLLFCHPVHISEASSMKWVLLPCWIPSLKMSRRSKKLRTDISSWNLPRCAHRCRIEGSFLIHWERIPLAKLPWYLLSRGVWIHVCLRLVKVHFESRLLQPHFKNINSLLFNAGQDLQDVHFWACGVDGDSDKIDTI